MQLFLPGTARYLDVRDLNVIPAGITGTQRLFPLNAGALQPVAVSVHFGAPIRVEELRRRVGDDRRSIMNGLAHTVAALLPPQYRGVYSDVGSQD